MNIETFLLLNALERQYDRVERMEEIRAPKIIIEKEREILEQLRAGDFGKVAGDTSLLEMEYKTHEVKKGNGGKAYYIFNDEVLYFPNAKYGRYVKRKEAL